MRKHSLFYLLAVLALLLSPAQAPGIPAENLRERIDQILRNSDLSKAQVSILIKPVDGLPLYERHSQKAMSVASNMKILTTLTALKQLGPNYQFKTKFLTNRWVEKNTIQHLYVKGGGDPYLVIERLWRIAGDLKTLGLQTITGDIIIDGSFFDDRIYPPGWPDNPGSEAYYAPTAAFAVNFNSIAIHVKPNDYPGEAPEVVLDPKVDAVEVIVDAKTIPSVASATRKKLFVERVSRSGGDAIRVSGHLPLNAEPFVKYRSVTKPLFFSGSILRDVLRERGITVTGTVREGRVPPDAAEIFEEKSPPLADLIKSVNKLSNNFMAEQILKTLAAEQLGPPGSTKNGVAILQKQLASMEIPSDEYRLENGSGLSPHNALSARVLVRLLEEGWHDTSIRPEFLASLALGGLDGTLEDRDLPHTLFTNIRAKTGSLDGVSCISGVVSRPDLEKPIIFSILMNQIGERHLSAHRVQDRILELVEGLDIK